MAALSTLFDDFSAGSRDTAKWSLGGFRMPPAGAVVATQGGGVVSIPVGETTDFTGFRSVDTYDATGSECFVKLVDAGVRSTGHVVELFIYLNDNNGWGFSLNGNTIVAVNYVANADTYDNSTPYDPDVHAWWRVRHDDQGGADDLVWETAPSTASNPPVSGDWEEFFRIARVITITSMRASFTGGCYNPTVGDVGTSVWDAFNTATEPAIPSGPGLPVIVAHLQQQGFL